MASIYDKLRPNIPQYGLGALSQAIEPFEQLLSDRRNKRVQEDEKRTRVEAFIGAGFTPKQAKSLADLEQKDRSYVLKDLSERKKESEKLSKQEQQRKELEDFYESTDLPRELARQPEFVQKEHLKKSMHPKSLGEHVAEFAGSLFGNGQPKNQFQGNNQQPVPTIIRGMNNQPIAVQIGSQIVSADQVSPETLKSLEMLQQQNAQNDQQDAGESTWGTKAGNFLSGLGTRYAGLQSGGDIVSAGVRGLNSLSNLGQSDEGRESEKAKWAERLQGVDPQTMSQFAQEGSFNNLANPADVNRDVNSLLPTTKTFQKGLEAVTDGTAAEKYVSSKNETDKLNKDIGQIVSLISRPGKTIADTALNFVKGTGAAVGGKLAGWLTEKATGSEKAGSAVENGAYIAYSLFPGLPSTLYNKAYGQFREKVIDPAVAQGKSVDLKKFQPQLDSIKKEIGDTFKYQTSTARQQLETEVDKIESFMGPHGSINPAQLWENAKTMGKSKYRNKIDEQAKGIFQKIINVQKEALTDFGNQFSPEAGEYLKKADDFYRTSKDLEASLDTVKNNISVRNFGAGSAIYLMSSFPTLLKAGLGYVTAKFVKRMLESHAVRSEISTLLKAGATQNTVLINKAMSRFNSQVENQLDKLPKKDQDQVREFINLANAKMIKNKSR